MTVQDDKRRCSNCGKVLEDVPHLLWLFHTCRSCNAEPTPARWAMSRPTRKKWRYEPEWHRNDHPAWNGPSMFHIPRGDA
jgi:hypothetical protein